MGAQTNTKIEKDDFVNNAAEDGAYPKHGHYCNSCKSDDDDDMTCYECGVSGEKLYPVQNWRNELIYVCLDCRDGYYTCCTECGKYYPSLLIENVHGKNLVCQWCRDARCTRCHHCQEYYPNEDVFEVDNQGERVKVCANCRNTYYTECEDCGTVALKG